MPLPARGTLEFTKVRNWIMFCLRMVEAANAPRPTAATRTTTAQVDGAPAPEGGDHLVLRQLSHRVEHRFQGFRCHATRSI